MRHDIEFLGLNNKVAIITGAATGLGASTAQMLSQAGAKVLINYMSEQKDQAQDIANSCVGDSLCIAGDITNDDDCRHIVESAITQWGRVDILVNNAGINKPVEHTDLEGLTSDDIIRIYSVNVIGAYQMVRAVTPIMQQQGQGTVINVSSISGEGGYGSSIAYSASKGAVNTMTQSLARALAPAIRVNAICPGMIVTSIWDKLQHTEEQREVWLKEIVDTTPLAQLPIPDLIARNILYLASDLSAHLTGQKITADGGTGLGMYYPMYNDK